MKKLKIVSTICLLCSVLTCSAQTTEKDIENVITEFAKAGDENNHESLATYLDDNFRIAMNRLFGSTEVSVMTKSEYIEKIKSKEYGGDKRELTIENILVNGTTASAMVTFKGTKMTFISLITLIQDLNGNWKLISEVPVIGL